MKQINRNILQFVAVVALVVIFNACKFNKKDDDKHESKIDSVVNVPQLKYGLPIDSFKMVSGVVKRNEYLGKLLNNYDISPVIIDKIAKKSDSIFDVRKIRRGQNYTFFLTPDSTQKAQYFVYESSPIDYVVYQLFDSLDIYTAQKEVKHQLRSSSGVVTTSLWNTMKDNNLDPMLALELSDIFAWTIDFFAIDKGDQFRVIYDELYVDTTRIGVGKVYAVQFNHRGEENYAIGFTQDDTYSFFDEEGKSLRKAFLKAPLRFSRISSRFSHSRLHPILRIRRPHHGVDYAAPKGTPVVSLGDGTVIKKAYQRRGAGYYLKIKHNSVYTTVYMHLSKYGKNIRAGTRVKQGQVVGYVGSTGLATGPHLDFRVFKNGKAVDPLKVKSPPVEPVKKENRAAYIAVKDSMINELHKINWQ